MVTAYPDQTVIFAHLGSFSSRDYKQHFLAIDAAERFENLHLETSSVVFFPYLQEAVRRLSAENLVFRSDGPLVDARIEIGKIRLLKLPKKKSDLSFEAMSLEF